MLDAFHIVTLAGNAPGEVRRRVQQDTWGYPHNRELLPAYLHHPRPGLHGVVTTIEHFYNRCCTHAILGGKSP